MRASRSPSLSARRSTSLADAQRILEAARAVFAEGLEASVADIAHRAGVGTATIFRRFPTKEDLTVAIVEDDVRAICERARKMPAVREFMTEALAYAIRDRGFCEAGAADVFDSNPRIHAAVEEVHAAVDEPLKRARAAGEVREDVVAGDLAFLIQAIAQAGVALERSAPRARRRYLDLVLDGLRPQGARPLLRKPPTTAQLSRRRGRHRRGGARPPYLPATGRVRPSRVRGFKTPVPPTPRLRS